VDFTSTIFGSAQKWVAKKSSSCKYDIRIAQKLGTRAKYCIMKLNAKSLSILLLMSLCGCSTTNPQSKSSAPNDYVPSFERLPKGYRPGIPEYAPRVDYLNCQGMEGAELTNIQEKFVWRLVDMGRGTGSPYNELIGAIVINGVPNDDVQTTFTIWLLDGKRLDSGLIFLDKDGNQAPYHWDTHQMGQRMYLRALEILRKAVPASKLRAAQRAELSM
jgi:hypothetical protein